MFQSSLVNTWQWVLGLQPLLGVADEVSLDRTQYVLYLSVENDELFNLIAGRRPLGARP
jgi:hypothetical protein